MGKNRRGLFGGRKNSSKEDKKNKNNNSSGSNNNSGGAKSKEYSLLSPNGSQNGDGGGDSPNRIYAVQTPKVDKKRTRDKAKQKTENNRSLRKIKKRDVVRQMLQRFPKETGRSASSSGGVGGSSGSAAFSASYDVSQAAAQMQNSEDNLVTQIGVVQGLGEAEQENNNMPSNEVPTEDEVSEAEANYASRKLMIRQMQGIIARGVQGDDNSEYDSWTDLEENFAREYEPIPLHIHMDTWRNMTKIDIIKTIRSKKMRKDFEYMSRSEILGKIEKMQKSAKYLSTKFGVDHLLPQLDHVVAAQVHQQEEALDMTMSETESESNPGALRDDLESVLSNFSTNIPVYLSRSEILKSYETAEEVRKEVKKLAANQKNNNNNNNNNNNMHHSKKPRAAPQVHEPNYMDMKETSAGPRLHDSWSSRASSILNNPDSIYVSRGEVLKNLHHHQPQKISKRPGLNSDDNHFSKSSTDQQQYQVRKGGGKQHSPSHEPPATKQQQQHQRRTRHDSWSSHASSILAKHAAAIAGEGGGGSGSGSREPNYVSRAELLEKLADLAYDTLSQTGRRHHRHHHGGCGGSREEGESSESMDDLNDGTESEASTVKNVVLKSQRQGGQHSNGLMSANISPVPRAGSAESGGSAGHNNNHNRNNNNRNNNKQQRRVVPPPLIQQQQVLQQQMQQAKRAIHAEQPHHGHHQRNAHHGDMNGHPNPHPVALPPKQRLGPDGRKVGSRTEMVEQTMKAGREDSERGLSDGPPDYYGPGGMESDCDTCSCTSCESYTDCSCCGDDDEEHIYSYTSSNSSVATVVEGGLESGSTNVEEDEILEISAGRDKGKHKDIYIVNGSEVSSKQSRRSGGSSSNHSRMRSKMTAASASANYDPIPKAKVKQMQLMEARSDVSEFSDKSKGSSSSSKNSRSSSSKKYEKPQQQMSSKEKVRKWDVNGQQQQQNPVPYAVNATPKPSSPGFGQDANGPSEKQKEFEKIYAPVNAKEIQRQKNERVLRLSLIHI